MKANFGNLIYFLNFVSRGREVANLARLITLKSVVRIHPNATKNLIQVCRHKLNDVGPKGHRSLTEFGQKNGSCDRNILATADRKFSREAQAIDGLFSFNHFLS